MSAAMSSGAGIDAWPMLRAAVAAAAVQHWRALRQIAPAADPRCVAAETVATQACHLLQSPALWEALHVLTTLLANETVVLPGSTLSREDVTRLAHQLEAMDYAAAAWAGIAFAREPIVASSPKPVNDA